LKEYSLALYCFILHHNPYIHTMVEFLPDYIADQCQLLQALDRYLTYQLNISYDIAK
jgi:hypothetical protein